MFAKNQKVFLLAFICLLFLVKKSASFFHLNDQQNVSSEIVEENVVLTSQSCNWSVPIGDLNLRVPFILARGGNSSAAYLTLIEDSKMVQTWLHQMNRQVADSYKLSNSSATQLKTLAADVENQFDQVNRFLLLHQNSSDVHQLIVQPLTTISESSDKTAQLFHLMATQFEQLFNLTKFVKTSVVKILTKLERAKSGVVRRKNLRVNSRRKLKMAMQPLRRSIADLTRRLQRDRVELKTAINDTRQDDANKARLEQTKWRWNCSRQALHKSQEVLDKWSQLDEELSAAIEESGRQSGEIHAEIVSLFNGTRNGSSSNLVQLERHRNLTTDFANYYKEASRFFLAFGSRISNVIADMATSTASSDDAVKQLKIDLEKLKCDLDRNGRIIILTDGKSIKTDFQKTIVGFVLGVAPKDNCRGFRDDSPS